METELKAVRPLLPAPDRRTVRPRQPVRGGHGAGEAVPQRAGVHRHRALRRRARRGGGGDRRRLHARPELPAHVLADNHTSPEIIFAHSAGRRADADVGRQTFLVHAGVGGNMDAADYGIDGGWWGIRLARKPSTAMKAALAGPTGARRSSSPTARRRRSRSVGNFQHGIAAPKFTQRDVDGRGRVAPGVPGHRLPDVPPRRRVPDLRRGGAARRWRQLARRR